MKMKRGVVAQLIYMLVLIAIAVVVGLFFMNIVEKNKKSASSTAIAELRVEVVKDRGDNSIVILSPQEIGNLSLLVQIGSTNVTLSTKNMTYNGLYYRYDTGEKCNNDNEFVEVKSSDDSKLFYREKCGNIPIE